MWVDYKPVDVEIDDENCDDQIHSFLSIQIHGIVHFTC